MDQDKYIDEAWKESVESEKQKSKSELGPGSVNSQKASVPNPKTGQTEAGDYGDANFLGYVASLAYQTMVFLGEAPNPFTQKVERNLTQAKFMIDTLAMLREKTAGNLTKEEEDSLNTTIYELQMIYVELTQKDQSHDR